MNLKAELELRRRMFKESGYFEISNSSSIAQNEIYVFTLDERFKPYDDVLIVNLSEDSDATIVLNYNIKLPLPKGDKIIPEFPINDLRIENNSSTTLTQNQIKVYYRSTGYQGKELIKKAESGISTLGSISLIKSFFT